MSSVHEYRLYTFVANLYLSPLQCGLQTAHVVSEIAAAVQENAERSGRGRDYEAFHDWAAENKTIIICGAGNHQGVLDCWSELERINTALDLPAALFREDEQSMNGMATACGVIVPKKYWDVQFFEAAIVSDGTQVIHHKDPYWEHPYEKDGQLLQRRYPLTHPEGQFISHIKQYRLA